MIERIEGTELYLYQGRIVDLAFLQDRKAELEGMIRENLRQIESITQIDCANLEGELKEAACLYNDKQIEFKNQLIEMNENFEFELQQLKIE